MPECPSDNTVEIDQSTFWGSDGVNWDAHRIGWAISGGCALLASLGLNFVYFLVVGVSSSGQRELGRTSRAYARQPDASARCNAHDPVLNQPNPRDDQICLLQLCLL